VKNENNKHPDANLSDLPWVESDKGKAWAEKGKKNLPFDKTLAGTNWNVPAPAKSMHGQGKHQKRTKTCESIMHCPQMNIHKL